MLKTLDFIAMAFVLVGLQSNPKPHPRQETQAQQAPSPPIGSSSIQKNDADSLKGKTNQQIDANVRVIETPQKDRYDKAGVWINAILAGIGLAGIIVAILTLCYLRKQAAEMRLQRRVMARTLLTMRRQVEIENKHLVLQFRPRFTVRHATATGFSVELNDPIACRLEFRLVNSGGSPAHVMGGKVQLLAVIPNKNGPLKLIDSTSQLQITSGTLQPGEHSATIGERMEIGIVNDTEWVSYFRGDSDDRRVILIGNIWYKDDLGIRRQTGLYRTYDPKIGTFPVNTDSEQEYSD